MLAGGAFKRLGQAKYEMNYNTLGTLSVLSARAANNPAARSIAGTYQVPRRYQHECFKGLKLNGSSSAGTTS